MATLTILDSTVSDTSNRGTASGVNTQAFKIPANSTITGVGIKGSQGLGASGTFRIEIYEGGTTPTNGTLKKSQDYTTTAALPAYTTTPVMQTVNFTTDTGVLTGGSTQYWFNITCLTGSAADEIRWSAVLPGTYPDGNPWINGVEYTNFDQNFAIYGTLAAVNTPRLLTMGVGM